MQQPTAQDLSLLDPFADQIVTEVMPPKLEQLHSHFLSTENWK